MNHATETPPRQTETQLADLLRIRASWLGYVAFAICVQRVLAAEGYEEVRMLGRPSFTGKPLFGGADMEALSPTPLGRTASLIQLKRHARSVPRRFVAELRGTMLHYGVPHGVVVAASSFSRRAREEADRYPGRPVRLVDGAELGRLMLAARIGVAEEFDERTGMARLAFNEAAFRSLEAFAANIRLGKTAYPLTPFQ